jgi:2-oxoglutarate ferredoxin oxidoreductase subunit alpha
LAAGLGFQAYYPISPATDESTWLESACQALQQAGTVKGLPLMIQAEDEIAALGMCCGAALTGARASTSTSGPGFSLMVEDLGWAGMNETPVVITLYQRGGPSTGMPTRTEQGDLLFAVHAGHGESPRIVFASSDIESCYDDAIKAFEYAERFQMPVIHLLDKTLASTTRTVAPFKQPGQAQPADDALKVTQTDDGHIKRFELPGKHGISPRPLIGNQGQAFWTTGVEHDEYGHVSEDPVIREQMMEKRARKLDYVREALSFDEKLAVSGDNESDFTIITWGSNKEPVTEAIELFKEQGIGIRTIQVRLLYPFPAEELASIIKDTDTLVAVECNQSGQFSLLMRQYSGISPDYEILKYNGRAHTGNALYQAIDNIVSGQASDKRIVIRNPWE